LNKIFQNRVILKIKSNKMSKQTKTRSQTSTLVKETKETFTHEFFLESSKEWLQNKKKLANGMYKYVEKVEKNRKKITKN
jgi:hypothetical protein